MKKIISIMAFIMTAAIVLMACGSTAPKEPDVVPDQQEGETTKEQMSQKEYDAGINAIDVMFDYLASHSKDTAVKQLQAIQDELSSEQTVVGSYINIFLVDIEFEKSKDDVMEDIKYLQDYLDERNRP